MKGEKRLPILTLDTREVYQNEKSSTILNALDSLSTGERMVLINDNDASDLLNKIEKDRERTFEWEHIKNTPNQWEATLLRIR